MNYYNEFDPQAAAWLRELIGQGIIAKGEVDERSIADVSPADLRGFTQCHFFAGIGGWPLALRLAGWPDDEPAWTGSCPCQPFSAAGKRKGTRDPRHLWPKWCRLIAECNGLYGVPSVFGEQVASADGRVWLSGVRSSLAHLGYYFGASDICAAGVGAPHIRQRLFWVADSNKRQRRRFTNGEGREPNREASRRQQGDGEFERDRGSGRMGEPNGAGREPGQPTTETTRYGGATESAGDACRLEHATSDGREQRGAESIGRGPASGCRIGRMENANGGRRSPGSGEKPEGAKSEGGNSIAEQRGGDGGLADAKGIRCARRDGEPGDGFTQVESQRQSHDGGLGNANEQGRPGQSLGFVGPGCQSHWSNFDAIPCLDGKARRVESGTFPLAHGVPGRVGLLRGYGNAIVPQVAAQFILSSIEAIEALK